MSSFCTSIPPELTVTTRGCSDLAAGEGIQYCNAGGDILARPRQQRHEARGQQVGAECVGGEVGVELQVGVGDRDEGAGVHHAARVVDQDIQPVVGKVRRIVYCVWPQLSANLAPSLLENLSTKARTSRGLLRSRMCSLYFSLPVALTSSARASAGGGKC